MLLIHFIIFWFFFFCRCVFHFNFSVHCTVGQNLVFRPLLFQFYAYMLHVFNQTTTQQTRGPHSVPVQRNCRQHTQSGKNIRANKGLAPLFFFFFCPGAPGRLTWSKITDLQLWLVGINAVHIVQLRHEVLGQTPLSVDAHGQGVCCMSMNPAEGGWEVSALMQNEKIKSLKR